MFKVLQILLLISIKVFVYEFVTGKISVQIDKHYVSVSYNAIKYIATYSHAKRNYDSKRLNCNGEKSRAQLIR